MQEGAQALSNAPDKQVTNGVVGSIISMRSNFGTDPDVETGFDATGSLRDSYLRGYAPRACSQVRRIAERYLRLTEKLLCEQRRNLLGLPEKGRWRGHQCQSRGSGPVVLDGVTPVQGVRESRAQGEGV